jgi:hypothetical protein
MSLNFVTSYSKKKEGLLAKATIYNIVKKKVLFFFTERVFCFAARLRKSNSLASYNHLGLHKIPQKRLSFQQNIHEWLAYEC